MKIDLCVPCLFGLEALVADELRRLGLSEVRAENGRVLACGEPADIARVNINLRCGERVLILAGEFHAATFEELFVGTKEICWENYIPENGEFPVKGHSLNSGLHSVPDCQKIIKKAVVERLKTKYKTEWFQESGARYQIQFSLMKDRVSLCIDTSGAGLHKRGYRPVGNTAPLRETLAAALVKLARYRGREIFCDPFCGSGTLPIEAALAAVNRAPGLGRRFAAMDWGVLEPAVWTQAIQEARDKEYAGHYAIWGGDIDEKCIEISQKNAERAGVLEHIRFEQADAREFSRKEPDGILVSNPPYGNRMMELKEAEELYRQFGAAVEALSGWKLYILSSHTEFERTFGKTANKKRKLYNGMIKCDLFMYL